MNNDINGNIINDINMGKSQTPKKRRYIEIDVAKGVAVLLMMLFQI